MSSSSIITPPPKSSLRLLLCPPQPRCSSVARPLQLDSSGLPRRNKRDLLLLILLLRGDAVDGGGDREVSAHPFNPDQTERLSSGEVGNPLIWSLGQQTLQWTCGSLRGQPHQGWDTNLRRCIVGHTRMFAATVRMLTMQIRTLRRQRCLYFGMNTSTQI